MAVLQLFGFALSADFVGDGTEDVEVALQIVRDIYESDNGMICR